MRLLVLITVAALGCGNKTDSKETTGSRRVAPSPTATADKNKSQKPGRWLILQQHISPATTARMLPVALTTDGPVVGQSTEIVAPELWNWRQQRKVLASAAGEHWIAAAQSESGEWQLHVHSAAEPAAKPRSIPLDLDSITGLLAVDHRVVVGSGNRVGYVDTSADAPSFTLLAERRGAGKAFDVFARDGDLIVAIDDEVSPIYAELLTVRGDREITHLEGWNMPTFINGVYRLAALSISDAKARDGVLYATGSYEIMSGDGQDLTAIPIRGGKLPGGLAEVLNDGSGVSNPPVIEEHVSRGSGAVEKIVHGKNMTMWTGLAVTAGSPRQVALAAGSRGLLLFPGDFDHQTKATAADLGGACHDIITVGEDTYALIADKDGGHLAKLAFGAGTATVSSRVELPAVYHRFVR